MDYAIIENGVCINAIVAESDFAAEIGAVLLPDGYGIGDLFDGTTWTKKPLPAPTEEELRQIYEELTVQYIREQYSENDEAKIFREYLANVTGAQEAFTVYNAYVESCKARANTEVYGN